MTMFYFKSNIEIIKPESRLRVLSITLAVLLVIAPGLSIPQKAEAVASRIQAITCFTSGTGATTIDCTVATPSNGNALIATIGTRGTTTGQVTSITQTGATWTKAVESANTNGITSEIWYALNVSGAGTSITINLASTLKASAVIAEYSGLAPSSALDKTATNTGNSFSPTTGITALTTTNNQLWIGTIANQDINTYMTPLNGFSEVAESASTGQSAASRNNLVYLEKNDVAIGTATTGAALELPAEEWSGTIATFKVVASTTYTQVAYRWLSNEDTLTAGPARADQNTSAKFSESGGQIRLRILLGVSGANLLISGETFKLQFASKGSGTCTTPDGSYTDVTGASAIAYFNNTTPADGTALLANSDDPTDGGTVIVNQTYEEANNFTNSEGAVNVGQDGKWDFSLFDNGATPSAVYCLRVVKSTGSVLSTYTVYPEITIVSGPAPIIGGTDGGSGGGVPQSGGTAGGGVSIEAGSGGGTPQGGGGPGSGGGGSP